MSRAAGSSAVKAAPTGGKLAKHFEAKWKAALFCASIDADRAKNYQEKWQDSQAENKRLRAALERIASGGHWQGECVKTAKEALRTL